MLQKLKKYVTTLLVVIVMAMGGYIWWQQRNHDDEVVSLHNKIAEQSKTIEVQKNTYKKKVVEVEKLESVLKAVESRSVYDAETIRELRHEIERKDEELLSATALVAKWKEAYEGAADAEQSEEPSDPDNPDSVIRKRVDFSRDFGYVGVEGYTLTDPAYAWVHVMQNRPLGLTVTLTQSKDKSWNAYVATSEDNVSVDVDVAGVNPFILERKWYENISFDTGLDVQGGLYPYLGLSYPIGPFGLSGGIWGGSDGNSEDIGWYATVNYSWRPFER